MTFEQLLEQIRNTPEQVQFKQVIACIEAHYNYTPQAFSNGEGEQRVHNAAGSNEGSCKILAFAKLQGLDEAQTLACFGDFYRHDVLQHPNGSDHANIRNFMRSGWAGVQFEQMPLIEKPVN
ncbi:MAG: HopJ type III effector protein [Granulosicoccaceae bacterium]